MFYPYKLKQLKINIKENLQFDVKHIVLNTMKGYSFENSKKENDFMSVHVSTGTSVYQTYIATSMTDILSQLYIHIQQLKNKTMKQCFKANTVKDVQYTFS